MVTFHREVRKDREVFTTKALRALRGGQLRCRVFVPFQAWQRSCPPLSVLSALVVN